MPQLRIRMYYGDVVLDFTDHKDLQSQLDKIDFKELEKVVTARIPEVTKSTTIMEEFKDLYTMDGTGKIVLKKTPKQKTDAIKLAIFLANRGLNTAEIKAATGITAPKSYMNVKKDFIQSGEYFSLQTGARADVTDRIIPEVRKSG